MFFAGGQNFVLQKILLDRDTSCNNVNRIISLVCPEKNGKIWQLFILPYLFYYYYYYFDAKYFPDACLKSLEGEILTFQKAFIYFLCKNVTQQFRLKFYVNMFQKTVSQGIS